jgi:SagB-type dehydrogenase family enzyme
MLDVYLIADQVSGLAPGLYKYQPKKHQLQVIAKGEIKRQMYKSLGHGELKAAPALIVVVGLRIRTPKPEWMYLEAGHAAQNIYLQATALGLSINAVTGFKETRARKTLRLLPQEIPIYILPVSKKVE